ncbi:hypothetical protein I4U23_026147 [Adineta vaga]|nr:hypothetical protein I4U23_026147 [Adineta vaga]
MAYQPHDISQCTFNESVFYNLERDLSTTGGFQHANGSLDEDSRKSLLCFQNGFPIPKDTVESKNTIVNSPSVSTDAEYHLDEQLFSDNDFNVVQEVTVTTTPSDAERNNMNPSNDILLEFDYGDLNFFTPEDAELCQTLLNEYSLQNLDESIEERTMSVEVEPPAILRLRYKTDGPRQIEKSRTNPMILKLPNLKGIHLSPEQTFLIRLILTTYSNDPFEQISLHSNKLEYHSNDKEILSDGTICVPISAKEVDEGRKKLSRLSFIKTKLGEYNRELTPLNLYKIDNNQVLQDKLAVSEAKKIFKTLKLEASRIICQLLIKQNKTYHLTNIICLTKMMEEKKQATGKKKRSMTIMESDDEEEDDDADERPTTSKSIKRKKSSDN